MATSHAQTAPDGESSYRMPPKAIADLIDAPVTPNVSIGPDRRWMLIMGRPPLPPISELAQPELRLAGLRINPRTNGPSRHPYYTKLALKHICDQTEREISGLPDDGRISGIMWSPDGGRIALAVTRDTGIELWAAAVADGRAERPGQLRLNAAYGSTFCWMPDSRTLICKVVPNDRGPAPDAATIPTGPMIQENVGKKAPARTYQDLLQSPHDEALFERCLTSQVVRVSVDGDAVPLNRPGLIRRAEPSPSGQYILVETIRRPFSYLVPVERFGRSVEIWDLEGDVVHHVADLPLAEDVPIAFDAVRRGPRSFAWRADAPATLHWTEAQDDGDPKAEADVRDQVYMLAAPFKGDPVPLVSLGFRLARIWWGSEDLAWISEQWWQTRRVRNWVVKPGAPEAEQRLVSDRSFEDRYSDPGRPLLQPTPSGTSILLTANGGKTLFLVGQGACPEGDRPFLDELDLPTGETRRLWRSEPPHYEHPGLLIDLEHILTRRESQTEPPNYFLRNLLTKETRQLTEFPHPAPQLANVQKELVRYKRDDGVDLTATLYLPPGYSTDDGPLPMLMWAYPREFKSADAAGQVTTSPCRFTRIGETSPLLWLGRGYAILEGPTMPIVGEGDDEPNDTYVKQLVASAEAAVDEVARRGVADRGRIAIGGHSYGAFMTANLLAHSDLFQTGIACSGAYNRTLTPFGFQAEERTLWEAPDVYFAMSPFMHVSKVKRPILLIHGAADNNAGTFPMQSERLYNALKGHGATARLVILPHESHGCRARESVMHMAWEMDRWLETYVNNARGRRTRS